MTETMNAVMLTAHGAPLRVEVMPKPAPAAGQVLVRVNSSAVNPLDIKISIGEAGHARHPPPAVLGIDLAGVVECVGRGVSRFRVGDEVYGMTGGVGGHQGSLAEYAAVDADLIALKPKNFDMRQSAALPLIFITAWEGLVDRAHVRTGQRVLVHGGAGGVGHVAVQLARAFGAQVFATASVADREFIEQLGAAFIAYSGTPVADYVARYTRGKGFDLIFDTVGGAVLDASFNAIARFGHVVSALGWGSHSLAPLSFRAASYSGVFTLLPLLTGEGRAHHGEILREASRMSEQGKIVPRVDPRHFSIDAVDEAHRALVARETSGKIVIDVA